MIKVLLNKQNEDKNEELIKIEDQKMKTKNEEGFQARDQNKQR